MALAADILVVQVSKGAAHAPPPSRCAADCEGAILADREATSVDGACLWGPIELELAIGNDGSCSFVLIVKDAVLQCAMERSVCCFFCCLALVLEGWILERANLKSTIDGRLAAIGRARRRRDALLDGLSQGGRSDDKRS